MIRLVPLIALVAGCALSEQGPEVYASPVEVDQPATPDDGIPPALPSEASRVSGDLPVIGEFEDESALRLDMYEMSEDETWVEVHVLTPDGWAMMGAPIDFGALEDQGELSIDGWNAVGCSGPSEGDWSGFDGAPDEIIVAQGDTQVIDGEVYIDALITADFGSIGHVVARVPMGRNR